MPFRHRYAHLALGIGLCLASIPLGQQAVALQDRPADSKKSEQAPSGESSTQPAQEPSATALDNPPTPTDLRAEDHGWQSGQKRQNGSDEDTERRWWWITYYDTAAQWIMSVSGIAALFVSIWAVWLLGRTLTVTRDAVAEAKKGAEAAEAAVKVTSDTAKRQLRAYLSFTKIETITITDHLRSDIQRRVDGYSFRLTIENPGQTPALECFIRGSVSIMDAKGFTNPIFPEVADNRMRSSIGPHSFVYGPMIGISRDQAQMVLEKKQRLSIWWRADYRDVFDDSPDRATEKIWEVEVPVNPKTLDPREPLPSFSFKAYGDQTLS